MFNILKRVPLLFSTTLIVLTLSFNAQALDKLEANIDKTIRDACYGFVADMLPEALREIIYKNSTTCRAVVKHKGNVEVALKAVGKATYRDPKRWAPRQPDININIDCRNGQLCMKMRKKHKAGDIPISQFDYDEVEAHCKYKDAPSVNHCVQKWFETWPRALPVERYEKAATSSVASGPVSKTNRIYAAVVEANFQYNKHESDRESANFTTGTVKLSITNKTRQPLSFGKVTVLHKCVEPSATVKTMGRTEFNSFYSEYYLSKRNKIVAGGNGTATETFTFTEKEKGPCGAHHKGVASSEVTDVEFVQKDMIVGYQSMLCGDKRVPVVWELRPESNIFFVYTDTSVFRFNADQLPDAQLSDVLNNKVATPLKIPSPSTFSESDGEVVIVKGKKLSLKQHVCNNETSDPATVQRWKAKFLHKMRKWGSACENYPDKCKKKYEKKYENWSSDGVRG